MGFSLLVFGVYEAKHSSLFLLRTVSVTPLSPNYPLTSEKVLEIARVPIGSVSLFNLNLNPIQNHLMKNPWVKGVVVGKQFPGNLTLTVIERTPVSLLTESNGHVVYLEQDGTTFEDQALIYPHDLPILEGFAAQNVEVLKEANQFIQTWFSEARLPGVKVSSLSYDEKLGLRAVISLAQKNKKQLRLVVELGLNLEEAAQVPSDRLKQVLAYISDRSMPVSKIWLGDGKKIVVKVLKGP